MNNKEILELSDKELIARISEENASLVKIKLNNAVTPLENTNLVKQSRRLIARLLTEKRKRELSNAK